MSDVIEDNNGWIPVDNQSPEVGVDILICDAEGSIFLTHKTAHDGFYTDDGYRVKDVKWWRELPEKPLVVNPETDTIVKVADLDEWYQHEWYQEVLRCISCDRLFMLHGRDEDEEDEGIIGCYCPYCGKKIVKVEKEDE